MQGAPLFTVQVKDLDYDEKELDEPIPVPWLAHALEGTEATPKGIPGRLSVTLSKQGRQIMVRGHAKADVVMPCARTLDPVDVPIDAELFVLLEPAPAAPRSGPAKSDARKPTAAAPRSGKKDRGREAPPGRKGGAGGAENKKARAKKEDDRPLADDEAALDTYDGEKVVLDGFVREFLLLELPLFPLREDLRSEATPATDVPPDPAPEGRTPRETVDPRLAPLAAIASRLREKKE